MSSIPKGSLSAPVDQQERCSGGAVDWSRFLHRPAAPPCLDWHELVLEKRILITGAGGSIGSSLAQLLMSALPRSLILLDRSGSNLRNLYEIYQDRPLTFPKVVFAQADILDHALLADVFLKHEPEIVFHAAALKHVVQLESDPFSALETNLLGTLKLLEVLDCFPVQHFVNLSTDKAVNPASVLGVSKRIVELLLESIDSTGPRLVSVRLGNVLESSGSVATIFLQCLRDRSPVPITDPRASRYFLTLEEAGTFLLRSLKITENSTLLPEMGAARTVLDLARFLLRTFQCESMQPILVTGLRDGEKRCEDLIYDYEFLEPTTACQISRVRSSAGFHPEALADDVARLLELVLGRQKAALIEALQNLVPEFTPSLTLLRSLH